MLNDGLVIAVLGMGIVFTFLCIMIFAMNIMSAAVRKLNEICPEPVAAPAKTAKKSSSNDEEIAVAIAAVSRLG